MTDTSQATSSTAINVGVVGHTNAGKTSLIRTLLRDIHFGQVDDSAGTTRAVEQSSIYANDAVVLDLFDTPGFEDSSALLIALDELSNLQETSSPAELLKAFISHSQQDRYSDFEQEIKVLRQSLNSDVLLYIIDVREPLLGKYCDEVEILSKAGKPILPVFNFIEGNDQALIRWREQMTLFNLHAALEFDTVAFDFEAEKRLYQKLQSLLERYYDPLQQLIDYRQQVWQNLNQAAARRIFQLICEVACYRLEVTEDKVEKTETGKTVPESDVISMQNFVRKAEQQALSDLLAIFSFTQLDLDLQQLPVSNGRWELDIFSPHMLKEFGLDFGASALSGAAVGAGIDLMVGGLSLGAASLLGAAVGGGWATAKRYQKELMAAWRGHQWLCVDDDTVSLLYLRQNRLLNTLTHRGHAAQNKIQMHNQAVKILPDKWNHVLDMLRQNPQWQYGAPDDEEYHKLRTMTLDWLLRDPLKR